MAPFDPLWEKERESFVPSSFGQKEGEARGFRSRIGGVDGESEPPSEGVEDPKSAGEESEPDAAPMGDGEGDGEGEGEGEGEVGEEAEALDSTYDGWIRVEEHEEVLAAARKEASEQARIDLKAEQDGQVQDLGKLVQEFERLVGERQWLRQEVIADAAEDVATLIMELSQRVVGETLAVHPRSLQHLVMEAMKCLPGDDPVRVRVQPEDLPILEAHVDSRRPITWIPDPALEHGIVVETDLGHVEASLEVAFASLQEAVADWLEQQRG